MEYVPRLTEHRISDYLSSPQGSILFITGAPQVGKTRMIEHALESAVPKRISFSLKTHNHFRAQVDACSGFNQFRKLLEDEYRFDTRKGTILFIDDIQESPVLASFIPRMLDAWNQSPIVLSGSLLPEEYEAILNGSVTRVSRLTVRPYQFSEFLKAHQKGSLSRHVERGKTAIFEDRHNRLLEWLERFMEVGGLPEVVDWASHGEDFSFHLDEIISGFENSLAPGGSSPDVESVNDALRSLAERPDTELPTALLGSLSRWQLIVESHIPPQEHFLFDLGISSQFILAEPVSFWDAESGDNDALVRLAQLIKAQTAVALQFQGVKLQLEEYPGVDFVAECQGSSVPIICRPVFSMAPETIEDGFSAMNSMQTDVGVIACLTPFEAVEREGKRLLGVPLYLMEALLDIVSRPAE